MTTKENLDITPASQGKYSTLWNIVKNTAMALTFASIPLGTTNCSNGDRTPNEPTTTIVKPEFTGTSINNRVINWEIVENLKGVIICENPETGQIFLSDGKNKLTDDFDDIREIGLFDGALYYIGINAGKPAIINEKGDTIFSGLDEIESYAIHNGDVAVIGKKDGKSCMIFNGKTIDEGKDYCIRVENNWIFTIASYYNEDGRVEYGYVNGKKVQCESVGCYREDGAYCGGSSFSSNGEGWTYFAESDKGNDPRTTIIHNWNKVGSNLRNLLFVDRDNSICSYVGEDGKKYMLFASTGRHYLIDREIRAKNGEESIFFVNDGKRSYYLLNGKLYRFDGLKNLFKPEDEVFFSSKQYSNGSIISLEVYNNTDFDPKYYNLFNGELIGTDANIVGDDSEKISCNDGKGGNIVFNNKLGVIIHEKDGKNYIEYNGENYTLEDSFLVPGSYNAIYIHSLEKSGDHYYLFDGKMYKAYDISNIGIKDGKVHFLLFDDSIGKEVFVFDGNVVGKLENITEVCKSEDGTIYLKGWERVYSGRGLTIGRKNVTHIHGTVRETIPDDNSEVLLHIERD